MWQNFVKSCNSHRKFYAEKRKERSGRRDERREIRNKGCITLGSFRRGRGEKREEKERKEGGKRYLGLFL
jgi:hypothetical protein